MRAARVNVYLAEAWHELRAGLRTSLVPLMFVGLIGYLFVMMTSADTIRGMGGAGVARNSPLLVYLMTSGQSFWLIFTWAWVFAQVVTRDRRACLDEIVLSAPVSLRGLLFARYAGALALAIILGSSSTLGLLLAPLLGRVGVLPPEALGPTPHLAIFWSWALFVVPSAVGLGALYLAAALRTRSTAGPFVAAAAVMLMWMVAMVVLRGGSLHTGLATVVDVTGFGEAEAQTRQWTPVEKSTALLALTPALLLNRLVWSALPLAFLAFVIGRQTREALVVERASRAATKPSRRRSRLVALDAPAAVIRTPSLSPSWARATLAEARFLLARTMSGWAFVVTAGLWTLINIGGAFYHLIGHAEGPFVPRAALLAPFLVKLCYVFSVLAIAGFVGALVRKDDRPGFDAMLDATPAPFRVRVLGRAAAALSLTLILALLPTLSAWAVGALAAPGSFELWNAPLINLLIAAPALLEIAALTFLVHALVRSAGTAYSLSMLVAFMMIVNHEVGIVSYPPGQLGVPLHIDLSELGGWSPWLAPVLELASLKSACVALAVAAAWAVTPRGAIDRAVERWRQAGQRTRGGAGFMAVAAIAVIVVVATRLHERIVVRAGVLSKAEQQAQDADWEARFWREATPFATDGGEVDAKIDVAAGVAQVDWKLRGVHADGQRLHGSLRPGMEVTSARVGGAPRDVVSADDFFAVDLGACATRGCDVELHVRVTAPRWFPEGEGPWLDRTGVWARASDLLPRLGYDWERALRAPEVRRGLGLAERPPALDPRALAPALSVAPAGSWRWSIAVSEVGVGTPAAGSLDGGLDFAMAWGPRDAGWRHLEAAGVTVWYGPTHDGTARDILEDESRMRACVGERLGSAPELVAIVQAPRGRGDIRMHDRVLWLPEDRAWDLGPAGVGRYKRRAAIAEALAARWFAERADLRGEPGSRWLLDGVAGWLGLECVRAADGDQAWLALLARGTERIADGIGALDAPLSGVADDGAASWVRAYAPQETMTWAQALGPADALRLATRVADRVRVGLTVRGALVETAGQFAADSLLEAPWASDLTVVTGSDRGAEIHGERFQWANNGWTSVTRSFEATQRFSGDVAPARTIRVPAHPDGHAPFVVFDTSPSYERSPLDNVWKSASVPPQSASSP